MGTQTLLTLDCNSDLHVFLVLIGDEVFISSMSNQHIGYSSMQIGTWMFVIKVTSYACRERLFTDILSNHYVLLNICFADACR